MAKLKILRISGIQLNCFEDGEDKLLETVAELLCIAKADIVDYALIKKSLDARKKDKIVYIYTVDVKAMVNTYPKPPRGIKIENTPEETDIKIITGKEHLLYPPVIVGAGPAGLFAALLFAYMGYNPLLIEQGKDVRNRITDIEEFWKNGTLKPESNVQFGEGGAGTFSDGKLTFRGKSPYMGILFNELVSAGAPEEILYWHKPHLGTDVLRKIIPNIRRKIINFGGQVSFNTKMSDIILADKEIRGVKLADGQIIPTQILMLGLGNSARDSFEMLYNKGVSMEAKPFAIGLRMEHSQKYINCLQYGSTKYLPFLPAADYHFTYQHENRGVYTFCMCPGGYIVNASSENGGVVTNGMSFSPRSSGRANSAVVASVGPEDFGIHPLDGMYWQQQIENKAFLAGGGTYKLPVQKLSSFLANVRDDEVPSEFRPLSCGTFAANLRELLPFQVSEAIVAAIISWSKKYPDFYGDDVYVAGIETRTSSPVRILRDETCESANTIGLYPIGEGAGYAGGIVSAAIDGLKAAHSVISRYAPPAISYPAEAFMDFLF